MAGPPLDELDPVAVRILEPGRPRSVGAAGQLGRARLEALAGKRRERGRQVVHLDRQIVEAADLDELPVAQRPSVIPQVVGAVAAGKPSR